MHVHNLDATVDELKTHLPQYLEDRGIDTTKNFQCLSPNHQDSTPSATLIRGDKPRVYCHGCGEHFDIFDAAQALEDKPAIGPEWVEETLKPLAEKYGVAVSASALTSEQAYEMDVYKAYKVAAKLLRIDVKNKLVKRELNKRGWTPEGLSAMQIGSVSSADEFQARLVDAGFNSTFLKDIDLLRADIFNHANMIFTWHDEKDRPIGFTARNLKYEDEKAVAQKAGESYKGKKYNNQRTSGLKCNIFKKGQRFYGMDSSVANDDGPLYIFEGQADVVTARTNGLPRSVAVSGSALREDHVQTLKRLGIFDVILCFDGDQTGREKLTKILEERFAGHRDMRVRVILMPEGEDPDSLISNKGIAEFNKLARWTAFEWRLNQYPEEADETDICRQMIPFIVNEKSPVMRDKQCHTLAGRTGVPLTAIIQELNILLDEKVAQKSQKRQAIIDNALYELRRDAGSAEIILNKTRSQLMDLSKRHSADLLSHEDFVRAIDDQKGEEEKIAVGDGGWFLLGPDLKELEEAFRGDWSHGSFICIGGKPNAGKTAFLSKLAYSIVSNNDDVVGIYHTIDDTGQQLLPRFVTIAEGSAKLTINQVQQPNYWNETVGLDGIIEKRDVGYKKVRTLAQDARLVVKDISHGSTIPFIENMICYYKERYPDRRLVYILDNFHKLRDFDDKDERVKYKTMSQIMKEMAIRNKCCIICTVEYTKLPSGIKPTNNNIGETGQIEYDASAIVHLYNDVSDQQSNFTVCHKATDWDGKTRLWPRVEFIVGKNKITEQRTSFFLDFYPASSDYRPVTQEQVMEGVKEMKLHRKNLADGVEAEDDKDGFSELF